MFWRRRRTDHDFREEIQAHIDLEAERFEDQGLTSSDARAVARKQFGNVLAAEERFYESGRYLWLEHLLKDLRYGFRILVRSPRFTSVAVLSVMLGVGVNSLIFSVVNSLLLSSLPVAEASELVFLENSRHGSGQSFPNYRDIRDRNQVFSGLIGYRVVQIELDSESVPVRTWGYLATGNYFDVLGVKPILGRFFHPGDDLNAGASPYVVLSYGSWRSRFAGDRNIIGKAIRINRRPYTVLGVAPREFHGTEVFYWPEVWVPMMMQAQIEPGNSWLEERLTFNTWVVGRLKPGLTVAEATTNLNLIAADLARQYPHANKGLGFVLARPGLLGDIIGGPVQAALLGVMVLASLLLLIACANLVSMISARGADRQREIAIRLSIGATQGRIMRQILTENVLLSALGGAAGYGLALLLSGWLNAWHAPMDFPVQFDVTPDWRVFLFSAAISLMVGVLLGLLPARRAARTDFNRTLKGDPLTWRSRRLALRDFLVVGQVALCFMLVCGLLLSLEGLRRMLKADLGINPQGVALAAFDLGLAGYDEERGRVFQQQALEAVENLPGVQSAAYSNSVPLSIDENHTGIVPEDQPKLSASETKLAFRYQVSPGFFKTLGIKLQAGRAFTWHDDRGAPLVAIVNRALAKQILHVDNAVGKRFHGPGGSMIEIVGMVEDGKYESPAEAPTPAVFVPFLQNYNTTHTLMVRSSLPVEELVARMREVLGKLDPNLPLFSAGSMTQLLGFAFFPARAAALALSAFGLLAVVLAITGIHGMVSYAVAQRTHEIGIRVALGASPVHVVRLVLGRTIHLLAVGSLIGMVLALASGKLVSAIVYEARPSDPRVLAAIFLAIAALGGIASWTPTRRALRIDPTIALRHE
ncbi:MAG TPA: ABC transporter permease [Candidatus Angelobacter sp.]|nr:ABC transporter permease [Candidatus Angelobacter sp.]